MESFVLESAKVPQGTGMSRRTEMRKIQALILAFLAALCVTISPAASDATIKGVVTDGAGKPVRGATVKATLGIKSISRFTQADGRYRMSVAPGTYDVSVEAYGFAPEGGVGGYGRRVKRPASASPRRRSRSSSLDSRVRNWRASFPILPRRNCSSPGALNVMRSRPSCTGEGTQRPSGASSCLR